MKKNYLFILLSMMITSSVVKSQPVLTAANSSPVAGEAFSLNCYAAAAPLPVTNGGPSQTWDVSPYAGTYCTSHTVLDPASTPFAALFPTATIAALFQGWIYDYHLASSTEYSYLGAASAGYSTVYTDFHKELSYPITYTDTFTDSFDNGMGEYGNLTAIADGYGTLITPSSTFNTVLRIHIHSISVVSTGDTIFQNSFFWYSPGIHSYVCFYSERTMFNSTNYILSYLDPISTGTQNMAAGAQEGVFLYPNPAHEVININGIEKFESAFIVNIQGQELKKVVPFSSSFNTRDLSRGIYFLKLAGKDDMVYRKFVVE